MTLEKVTLERKIGEMIMLGFRGTGVKHDMKIYKDIKAGKCGGVVLFSKDIAIGSDVRNIVDYNQVQKLNQDLQNISDSPLLISIDQEGGKVARLNEEYGFPKTVSQEFLGKKDDTDFTAEETGKTVTLLSELGFNLNYTPCLDVNVNPDCPVIGKKERSFSNHTDIVAKHSEVIINKHLEKNILCSGKHFPGHGSSLADSHIGFTDVSETWSEIELEPYRVLIGKRMLDVVMSAHIFNSKLDEKYPATLSEKTINGLLRGKLGYEGVVITDDMSMGAITKNFGLEEAVIKSINAGCDILLFANTAVYDEEVVDKAIEIIKSNITAERIDKSYQRISKLKSKLC
jgi:beta-N-acetylhexosaminidase